MTRARTAGLAGRLLLLVVLALALADPPLPAGLHALPDPGATGTDLVIVHEDSADARRFWTPRFRTPAVGDAGHGTDPAIDPTTDRGTPTLRADLARALDALPAGSRVAAVRFGAGGGVTFGLTPAAKAPLERLFDAGGPSVGASLGAAIDSALALGEPGRRFGVLVLAHGDLASDDATAALARARDAGVPVRWRDLRGEPAPPGLRVAGLHAPRRVRAGEPVAVNVVLDGHGSGTLQLWVDGRLQREQAVDTADPLSWQLRLPAAGTHHLRARVSPASGATVTAGADPGRDALVHVAAPATVLYVSRDLSPPMLRSLRAGGWPLSAVAPGGLADGLAAGPAAVVLDDVALGDLSAGAVDALARQVRDDGAGLVVLGGATSFGGGGYPGSRLEGLLPVTCEGARRGGPAAVLFLVDTSGSMGRDVDGDSREGRARRAVVEAAASIAPGDLSGVYTYDVDLRRTLPLAPRARPAAELRAALRGSGAGGGTRLAPALAGAVADLARTDVAQRILVLVTDGHLDPGDELAPLQARIAAAGIRVVPVVIGARSALAPLHRLAQAGGGAVLRVHRATALPRLLREAIDAPGDDAPRAAVRPLETAPLPLLAPVAEWPPLRAWQTTRARPAATVYLRAPGGAPLLAAHRAGAGRVLALPGGLAGWAPAWAGWSRFGDLVQALVRQVAAPWDNPRLQLQVTDAPGSLQLRVDAAVAPATPVTASLAALPSGAVAPREVVPREVALEPLAPQRHGARVTGVRGGRHALTVRAGDEVLRAWHLHRVARDPTNQVLAPAVAAGLLRPFDAGEAWLHGARQARAGLVVVAAFGYPLLLAAPWIGGVARRAFSARAAPRA